VDHLSFSRRSSRPDELDSFNKADRIGDFQSFIDGIDKFILSLGSGVKLYVLREKDFVHLVSLSDENFLHTLYSVRINSNITVSGYHCTSPVSIKDILGFQYRLERWSQLEDIMLRVKHCELSFSTEVRQIVKELEQSVEVEEGENDGNVWFILEQLLLQSTSSHGRRYSARTMNAAISLYLNSKSCYRLLRRYLALPAPKTLTKNIGNLNTIGTDADAEYISNLVFSSLDNTLCIIVFDEIYVKPSVRFRGGHTMRPSQKLSEALSTYFRADLRGIRQHGY
jgi:hypothetical protein